MKRIVVTAIAFSVLCLTADAAEPVADFGAAVRVFSSDCYEAAKGLAAELNLSLPAEAHVFFHAAVTGDWASVSNSFTRLSNCDQGGRHPALMNELWPPVHEAIGAWEIWRGWQKDSDLLAMFHEPVLSSMPAGSVYFGGTAHGRFVITALNQLSNPPPLVCIAQRELSNNTYVSYLRTVYSEDLWLPQNRNMAEAFQTYVEEIESGKRQPDDDLKIADGRVEVTGPLGLMEVNGIIAKMIFEHNKRERRFFVEMNLVIDRMYPYLEPHGLIMKLHPEPLDELPAESVARDRAFWARHEERLFEHPGFASNREARQAFSKLRSAIAGLYRFRGMPAEAEDAYHQAIRLCPYFPEPTYNLVLLLASEERWDDAIEAVEAYMASDSPPGLATAAKYVEHLKEAKTRMMGLEEPSPPGKQQ